jgi:tetratricopeptide (TPR) repeat protein
MKPISISFATAAVILIGWFGIASVRTAAAMPSFGPEPVVHPTFDPDRIEREIKFHEGRVQRDPKGALGWSMLSAAYLAKSREYDSDLAAWKAEEAALKSLELRRKNNTSAAKRLIQSMLEQHRFQDALAMAIDSDKIAPGDPGLLKLKIDILIEVGRYDEAQAGIGKLDKDDGSIPTLEARLLSLKGEHAKAASALEASLKQLQENRDVRSEDLAWYHVKIGNELMAEGKLDWAKFRFETALVLHPRNYKARLSMAHLSLKMGNAKQAIQWANKVLEVADSMEAKNVAADAELARGNKAGFEAWKQCIVDQFVREDALFTKLGKGGPLNVRPEDRAFANFCSEHRIKTAEAISAAKRDQTNRDDAIAERNLAILG